MLALFAVLPVLSVLCFGAIITTTLPTAPSALQIQLW